MQASGFPPIARPNARILILGTLPGSVSLMRQQYYAQQHNAFWRIMGIITGASLELPYADRVRKLQDYGIALWDVCAAAFRQGSLDTAIRMATVVPNDFHAFLNEHQRIHLIAFNGAKARDIFDKKVYPSLPSHQQAIERVTLPSTSPANAGISFEQKLERWRLPIETTQRLRYGTEV